MNKLKTTDLGGFPVVLDDLRWIDDSVRDAFKAIFASYGDKFIISGCDLSYDNINLEYTCTEGYIYFNGEILKCAGGIASHDGEVNIAVWNLETLYDAAGLKAFANEVSHDTYEIRRAKFQSVDIEEIAGKLLATSAKRLHELISESLIENEEDWRYPGEVGEPAFLGSWETVEMPPLSKIRFKKDLSGNVFLQGHATAPTAETHEVFQLPSGYRPAKTLLFVCGYPNENHEITMVVVTPSGYVSGPVDDQQIIGLDGIVFKPI